jgi:hypothetical protein
MLEYDVTGLKPYIISTSSKGNQDKWCINNKWIKADQFGYEGLSEVVCSRLANALKYPYAVTDYEPCKILLNKKL